MQQRTKKVLTVLLTAVLFLSISLPAFAADANSTAGTVRITSGSLNVRSAPSTSASIVSSLYKNETVTLLQKSGDFWKVEYGDGKYGYAHANYIAPISGTRGTRENRGRQFECPHGCGDFVQYSHLASEWENRGGAFAKRRLGKNPVSRQKYRLCQQRVFNCTVRVQYGGRCGGRETVCCQF